MNRRTRILTAIDHRVPDRIPISFDLCPPQDARIFAHYGVGGYQQLYEKTGIDCFSVWTWPAVLPEYAGLPRPGVAVHDAAYGAWGKVGERRYPLAGRRLDEYRWPSVDDFDFSTLRSRLRAVKQADMTTASGHAGVGWLHHVQMRSYGEALYDVLDEAWMEEYMGRNREFQLAYFAELFRQAEGEIDIIRADEDLGGQDAMLISPDIWRRWYKPLWREIFELCRRSGVKVWLHSCGYCRSVLEDFIEMGADILNPVPPYVRGGDPAELKRIYGDRLCFDGGVDQMNVLVGGTPADVQAAHLAAGGRGRLSHRAFSGGNQGCSAGKHDGILRCRPEIREVLKAYGCPEDDSVHREHAGGSVPLLHEELGGACARL